MNLDFDQAEISIRRYSSSQVLVNDSIRLEYMWLTLMNGDTITFGDGSRYTFYNIYNVHEIDEILIGSDSYLRYVRRNMLDEDNKLSGSVQYLSVPTNYDSIPHSTESPKKMEEEANLSEIVLDEEDEDVPEKNTFFITTDMIPKFLSTSISAGSDNSDIPSLPEPLDEVTPEVPETDAKEMKEIADIQEEIRDKIHALNTKVSELVAPEEVIHRHGTGNASGNPFDDGDGPIVELEKKDKMKYQTVLHEHMKNGLSLSGKGGFGKGSYLSPSYRKRAFSPYVVPHHTSSMKETKSDSTQYDDRTYVLYRSKQKIMPAACDVYDVRVGTCNER